MNLTKPKIFKLKPAEHWFQNILCQLEIKISDQHPTSIFYHLGNEIIMRYHNPAGYQELNNGSLYVKYFAIWPIFESRFGLNYGQIRGLIKSGMEEQYNFRGLTPQSIYISGILPMEEQYNFRGLTPNSTSCVSHVVDD